MAETVGEMKYRVTLLNPARKDNGRGGYDLNYENGPRMEVWAAAKLLTIEQQMRYRQTEETPTIRFKVRENPFIRVRETRFRFDGADFKILQAAPLGRAFMEIRAREV